jgi:mannan endo-1,4-beta-mannosidase
MAERQRANPHEFVRREGKALYAGAERFVFMGANAHYLPFALTYGEFLAVDEVLDEAHAMGMAALRTWAFHDSPDRNDPGVFQYRPGVYNEQGLCGLDGVVARARKRGIRLLMPLVNNWDDYGGMNQYVRWRQESDTPEAPMDRRYDGVAIEAKVESSEGKEYRLALSPTAGHDDFYTDPVIRGWFKQYIAMLLQRVNTVTGVAYRDEPAILSWELANEPRSSDRTGLIIARWLGEMAAFTKSIDSHHLVGSGEEGGDVSSASFPASAHQVPSWLLDGSMGGSFVLNTALQNLDFASLHLYAEAWGMPQAGESWIHDHVCLAAAAGKPLVLGEFGAREGQAEKIERWLATALQGDAAGALVWQLLDRHREDPEGYGIHCGDDVCSEKLRGMATLFAEAASRGSSAATGA